MLPGPLYSMATVRRNLVTAYASSLWTAAISLLLIPVYVRFLGIEAYGLVGFFITLQSMFSILDFGLTTTLNREFARLSPLPSPLPGQRRLLCTIEAVYWTVALFNGAVVITFARPIAELWIRPEQLSRDVITQAVMMMGLVVVLQWPLGMYSAGLLGLQQQVRLNIINTIMATLRAIV